MKSIINKLRYDEHYYGSFGKQYLSNSDIGTLLKNPKAFRSGETEQSLQMLQGRYLHTAILEPHKVDNFVIIDASTRNTNIYKNESGGELCLLLKEKEDLDLCIQAIKNNKRFNEEIYAEGNLYEEPAITKILRNEWKGKADIVTSNKVIDIKTTTDISKFAKSAYEYNYDSQAFIYQMLFKYPLEFFVVDKNTQQLGIFTCSDDFLERGFYKVKKATEIYTRFFKDGGEDVNQYFIEKML